MGVEIDIRYEGGLRCRAVHGPSGVTLTTDAPVDNGGQGASFSPTDLVATGFGSCILTIMGLQARQRGLDITGTRVHVVKEMVSEPVRRIGALRAVVTFPKGWTGAEEDRQCLARAAESFPVRHSLHPEVQLSVELVYQD